MHLHMNERHRHYAATEGQQQERQDKPTEAMVLLEQGIEGILDSEGFATYLKTMTRFQTYSFRNVLMILAQRPEATEVAGYRTWQSLGRQVRKGETGMVIFVPHRRSCCRHPQHSGRAQSRGGSWSVLPFGEVIPFVPSTEGEALFRAAVIEASNASRVNGLYTTQTPIGSSSHRCAAT
jgi:hypothetical protein